MKKPKHVIIKLLKAKDKEENLKSKLGRVKTHCIQRSKIRVANFLSEEIQLKRWWSNILKVFKEKYMNLSASNSVPCENIFKK